MTEKIKKSLEPVIPEVVPEETDTNPPSVAVKPVIEVKEPNEAFFGSLLLSCLVISLLATTGYFGYSGYRYFKAMKAEQSIPSIAALPTAEALAQTEGAPEEVPKEEDSEKPVVAEMKGPEKSTLAVKVLNGGAVKGVAGVYVEKLKKDGFTKTLVGNSFGSYTGVTLYYAKDQESGMAVFKEAVLKDYPKLVMKPAEAGNKDTTAAPLTLILGQ